MVKKKNIHASGACGQYAMLDNRFTPCNMTTFDSPRIIAIAVYLKLWAGDFVATFLSRPGKRASWAGPSRVEHGQGQNGPGFDGLIF